MHCVSVHHFGESVCVCVFVHVCGSECMHVCTCVCIMRVCGAFFLPLLYIMHSFCTALGPRANAVSYFNALFITHYRG